jgi:hypothetical protein
MLFTLKKNYKGLEVYHISDIIRQNIDKLPLKEIKKKVMYTTPVTLAGDSATTRSLVRSSS